MRGLAENVYLHRRRQQRDDSGRGVGGSLWGLGREAAEQGGGKTEIGRDFYLRQGAHGTVCRECFIELYT